MAWEQPTHYENISATTAPFTLFGGKYIMTCIGTGFGTVDLQLLANDGSTYFSVLSAAFGANGLKTLDLPPGTYKVVITTTTAVYVKISHVPYEQ